MAILALLAGIIYAVLGPVREKGRQMVCMSNLKQVYMALQMYRSDYNGFNGPGRYLQMGLPPNLSILASYAKWQKDPDGLFPLLMCPDFPPPELVTSKRSPRGDYTYQVCDDDHFNLFTKGLFPFIHPCSIPNSSGPVRLIGKDLNFAQRIRKHEDNYAIVFDANHGAPRNLLFEPRSVIILRLNGKIEHKWVPRASDSKDW
jgi:hypothetical protein